MRDKSKYTPMMQQYLTIKENYQDAFVFFRLGDFYELFFEDAQLASKELEIAYMDKFIEYIQNEKMDDFIKSQIMGLYLEEDLPCWCNLYISR